MTSDPHTQSTPLPIIAHVSRVVTRVVDRVSGDRSDSPLLVAAACAEALKAFQIPAWVMYGPAAWVEVLEDHSVIWAGCWGESFHFWTTNQFGEIIDLNASVQHRKRAHSSPQMKSLYSPPILWSSEVPGFYRYIPEGIAELELTESDDQRRYERVLREIAENCGPDHLKADPPESELDFPNEPILCPGRKLLDDSRDTFRHFDRAVSVRGIPPLPPQFR